jgi:iron complex outermembrane receptor protein
MRAAKRKSTTATACRTQYQAGSKNANSLYSAYINAFYTNFTGISFQQITTDAVLNSVSGSRGHGVEFELALRR